MMRPVHGRPTTMAARVHAVASPSSRMMPPSTNCLHWAVEGSGPRRQPGRVLHCRQLSSGPVQGLKPLALSSSSCASLNGKKIKFQVFEWRGRGRLEHWRRDFLGTHSSGAVRTPPIASVSRAPCPQVSGRRGHPPSTARSKFVRTVSVSSSFVCIHVVCSSGARSTPSQAAFIFGSGCHG